MRRCVIPHACRSCRPPGCVHRPRTRRCFRRYRRASPRCACRTTRPIPGFAIWRRSQLPRHDKTPAAWTMRGGDWDFLIATPRAMDAMDTSRIIDTTLANCRRPLNISEGDSAKVADARPWAPFDSLVDGRPVLVISIMPVLRNFTECGFKNLGRPAMIRRGLRFVTSFAYDAKRDPVSAVVLSQLRIVKPVMLARAPVIVMSRGGEPQPVHGPDPDLHPVRRDRADPDRRHAAHGADDLDEGRRRAGPHPAPGEHHAHRVVGLPALARAAARGARQGHHGDGAGDAPQDRPGAHAVRHGAQDRAASPAPGARRRRHQDHSSSASRTRNSPPTIGASR